MRSRLEVVNIFTFFFLAMYVGVSFVLASLIVAFPGLSFLYQSLLTYFLGFGVPVLAYGLYIRKKSGQSLKETFLFHKTPISTLLMGVAIGFLIQPIMQLIAGVAGLVFKDITTITITDQTMEMPLYQSLIAVALMPAIFEELLCRGMLLDGYRETPVWYTVLIPALFFGLLHLNFQQISYTIAGGIMLVLLARITGSIWPSMIAHFVLNGTQVSLSYLMQKNPAILEWPVIGTYLDPPSTSLMLGTGLIGAGICVPLLVLCYRFLAKRYHWAETRQRVKEFVPANWHKGAFIMYILMGGLLLTALLVEFALDLVPNMMP